MSSPLACPRCSRRIVLGADRADQPRECPSCHIALVDAPRRAPEPTLAPMQWTKRQPRGLRWPIGLGLAILAGVAYAGVRAYTPAPPPPPLTPRSIVVVDSNGPGALWHAIGCAARTPSTKEMHLEAADGQGHPPCPRCTAGRGLPPLSFADVKVAGPTFRGPGPGDVVTLDDVNEDMCKITLTETTWDRIADARKGDENLAQLVRVGEVVPTPKGTKARILALAPNGRVRVVLADGPHRGVIGWIRGETLNLK